MLDNVKEAPARAKDNVVGRWGRSRTFLTQVRNEMERVTWPTRKEVYATTLVVLLTAFMFGIFLYGLDLSLDAAMRGVFRLFGVS